MRNKIAIGGILGILIIGLVFSSGCIDDNSANYDNSDIYDEHRTYIIEREVGHEVYLEYEDEFHHEWELAYADNELSDWEYYDLNLEWSLMNLACNSLMEKRKEHEAFIRLHREELEAKGVNTVFWLSSDKDTIADKYTGLSCEWHVNRLAEMYGFKPL